MAIILRLDRMMADRKTSLNELSEKVGIANVNLSKIKTGKVSAIRFSTLNAICDALDCQPGDILEFQKDTQEDWFIKRGCDKTQSSFVTSSSCAAAGRLLFSCKIKEGGSTLGYLSCNSKPYQQCNPYNQENNSNLLEGFCLILLKFIKQ